MTLPRLRPGDRLSLEPTYKWIRAYRGGRLVADSRRAQLVRGGIPPPRTYAFPPEDLRDAVPDESRVEVDGFVALQWDDVDHWYEEGEEVFVHPRDPHKRIDVLTSTRHVVIRRDGEILAESHRPVLLFESVPQLPVRYYLHHDDVDRTRLRPNPKTTACPYKGWANYYDVKVGDRWHEALAWTYRAPFREVEPIRGLLCFFNERVDMTEDGQALPRPKSPFS